MAHITLVKTVRSLDQGEPTAEKLDQLWAALCTSTPGASHAAENVVVRWLLKHMNGTSPSAETVRRWPLTWSILSCVFQRMPLFSLAKSLAFRRFIAVLQQTVEDLSKPQKSTSKDGAPPSGGGNNNTSNSDNPRKRKASPPLHFDLESLRQPQSSLRSASHLFDALGVLLARLYFPPTDQLSNDRLGAEQVKSLFSSSATDAMAVLVPMLRICSQSLMAQDCESLDKQDSWIRTFVAIWNLRLQGPADAFEAATHLAPPACLMLGRLLSLPRPANVAMGPELGGVWATDLQRFLTSHVILPARSAFLNKKDVQILLTAIGDALSTASIKCAVLFHLALDAPQPIGDAAAKRDNQDWTQKVFEMVEEPLQALQSTAERNETMSALLGMASSHGVAPSLDSLRSVCRDYALDGDSTDWQLISSIANCDSNVFLVSLRGGELLDLVLRRIPHSEALGPAEYGAASDFMVALARGFAASRDLSGFLKIWAENLEKCDISRLKDTVNSSVWFDDKTRLAVADLVQPSLSTQQLLTLASWLESRCGAAAEVARLVLFDAISAGLRAYEYVDAAGTSLFDHLPELQGQSALPPEIVSIRWRIARRALREVEFQDAQRMWTDIKKPLGKILRKHPLLDSETFEVFRCCLVAAGSLKFGGQDELEARTMNTRYLARLNLELERLQTQDFTRLAGDIVRHSETNEFGLILEKSTPSPAPYLAWILCGFPRFFDCITENSGEIPRFLNAVFTVAENCAADLKADGPFSDLFLAALSSNLTKPRHQNVPSIMMDILITALQSPNTKPRRWTPRSRVAVRFLLQVPKEKITRQQRELIVPLLLSLATPPDLGEEAILSPADWLPVLSLMARLMSEPTFYEDMKFDDLIVLGESLDRSLQKATLQMILGAMDVFRHVADMALRQMVSSRDDRAKRYVDGIKALLSVWEKSTGPLPTSRLMALGACLAVWDELPPSAIADLGLPLEMGRVETLLAAGVSSALVANITASSQGKPTEDGDPRLGRILLAAEAAGMDRLERRLADQLRAHLATIKAASDDLDARGSRVSWRLKVLLARLSRDGRQQAPEVQFLGLFPNNGIEDGIDETAVSPSLLRDNLLQDYLAALTKGYTDAMLLSYLQSLVVGLQEAPRSIGRLISIHYMVKRLPDVPGENTSAKDEFDLATAHGLLAQVLPRANSPTEFGIVAQILVVMLDEKASWMGQWNVETTLSCISAICVGKSVAGKVRASPTTYAQLCRLAEVVFKRHRLTLDRRFPLVLTTLEFLLAYLISYPKFRRLAPEAEWKENTKRFSRLLELVCEPSAASVARTQKSRALSSATEVAKRSAGKHMYVVLMAYIKLQLEHDVPRAVREALEPGVFSVLAITPDESCRVMNDAMDASGRTIFREMYGRWQRFGKWRGE